jgi:uncharacterized Zn-binding protein involved in type VI secretion
VLSVRELLTANRTYYFRTDGSNSNDGLTNSSGGAFLTAQKAIDVCYTLDLGGFTVTIKSGNNGTYTTNLTVDKPFVGGIVQLEGDTTTPGNVILSTTGTTLLTSNGATIYIKGFKIVNASSGSGLEARSGSIINVNGNMEYGAAVNGQLAAFNGTITVTSNFSVSGNSYAFAICQYGLIDLTNRTCTVTGTPAYSGNFAYCYNAGLISAAGFTFSGAGATGSRYNALGNGVIYTAGGGASFFPGDSAGSTSTGGQYT